MRKVDSTRPIDLSVWSSGNVFTVHLPRGATIIGLIIGKTESTGPCYDRSEMFPFKVVYEYDEDAANGQTTPVNLTWVTWGNIPNGFKLVATCNRKSELYCLYQEIPE